MWSGVSCILGAVNFIRTLGNMRALGIFLDPYWALVHSATQDGVFIKVGQSRPLFRLFVVFFNQTFQFL